MSDERKEAKPFAYSKCYLGESSAPEPGRRGSSVQEIGDSILTDSPCVVFELRDFQAAIKEGIDKELLGEVGGDYRVAMSNMVGANPDLGVVRFFISIHDARHLACHLIHALARTGDRVASRLEEVIKPAIIEAAEAEGRSNPFLENDDESR